MLDNCEQVVAAVATVLVELLAVCPNLKVLVTSRILVHATGEHVFPVSPLATPGTGLSPEQLEQNDAVRLFLARAQAAKPDFALSTTNAQAVASLCSCLDGLPLALELAAAWVRLFSLTTLQTRLEHRLPLLVGGPSDQPGRLRTMRSAIAWSYDLLPPAEQRLFGRLTVFVGGCTLEAAEIVGIEADSPPSDMSDILERVASLVDQSLLQQKVGPDEESRFEMLETIREFGLEQLRASGEEESIRQRHAAWCLALAEEAAPHLTSAARDAWMAVLTHEQDNLRSALGWVMTWGQNELALRLTGALTWFWYLSGNLTEGRRWLASALALPPPTVPARALASALTGAGSLAHLQGDEAVARPFLTEGVTLWRELGDRGKLAYALTSLGQVAWHQGDAATTRVLGEESVALFRTTGDRWGPALALQDLGQTVLAAGDLTAAQVLYEEILAIYHELGDHWGCGLPLLGLGRVARARGDYAVARAALEDSRAIFAVAGDRRLQAQASYRLGQLARQEGNWARAEVHYHEALALWHALGQLLGEGLAIAGLAGVAAKRGEMERAARLGGAAEAALAKADAATSSPDRDDDASCLDAARALLGAERFTLLWAVGRALPLERAVAEALVVTVAVEPVPSVPAGHRLTPRELDVLRLLVEGRSDKEIASALGISYRTTTSYVTGILTKLNVSSRTAAATHAVRHGIV